MLWSLCTFRPYKFTTVSQQHLSLKIEPLTLEDIRAAILLEQVAYATQPPRRDYDRELQYNPLAHYLALRVSRSHTPTNSKAEGGSSQLIGLAGFWLVADEIEIMTLAISPRWKGFGLGDWLLLNVLEKGKALGAKTATLEVRPSNHVAISLYKKYQFQEVGRRPNYYPDNLEDALILTTPPLDLPDYQALLTRYKAELLQRIEAREWRVEVGG